MSFAESTLRHSVAFRVSEAEWVALQRYAKEKGMTVPQAAKEVLFEMAGLKFDAKGRRPYGQVK